MSQKIELILAESSHLGQAGQKVELVVTPSDVHVAEEMATYMAGYDVPGYRADEASKVILVDSDEDKYRNDTTDNAFKPVQVKASLQAPVPEVDPATELSTYKVVDRFVGSFVPVVTELNAQKAFRPRQAALKRCKKAIQIDRELDVWTLFTTDANWNANNIVTLGATENWNGGAASDPILALQRLAEASWLNPIEFWMNQKVANAFVRHAKVKDHFRFFNGDAALAGTVNNLNTASEAGQALDFVIPAIGVVHVVGAVYKAAAGTKTAFLGDNYVVATHSPPGVPTDAEDTATSYTFRRRGPSGTGFETREVIVENRGPLGGTLVVTSMADIAKMTGPLVGGLLKGVVT
jgi:hypothetical protein